jgi:hypothetical protein
MAVRYIIDKERRLVLTTGVGHVTIKELKAHQDQLLSDPAFDPSFNQLNDYSTATTTDVSVDQLRGFRQPSSFLSHFSPRSSC